MMKRLLWSLVLTFTSVSLLAQSVTFEAEELTISPSVVTGSTKCVQVGLFVTYTGGGAASESFMQITSTLNYTAPAGFLAGVPQLAHFGFNAGLGLTDGNGATAGGGDSTILYGTGGAAAAACTSPNTLNSVTENGAPVETFMAFDNASNLDSVSVNAGTGAVSVTVSHFSSDLFTLDQGTRYLFAVLEFPLAADQGTGQIDLDFDTVVPDGNIVNRTGLTVTAQLDNGYVQVFDTIDCGDGTNYAQFDDAVGSGTANTMNGDAAISLDYLDAGLGGPGGEMDVTVNYGAGVVGYQITGDDGYDSGVVAVVGPGSSNETINPSSANATTIYDITFFVLGLDGITLVPGNACQMTATWNDAACTLTWQNNGIGGANSVLTATITNALPTALVYGQVDVPNGAAGLADPIDIVAGDLTGTAGGTATFVVIDQSIPDGTWAGDYTLSSFGSPSGVTPTDCVAPLGFVCPSNVTITSITNPVTIGGAITVEFSGDDVTNGFDVIYNGTTTSNATSPFALPNTADGSVLTVEVVGNGFGPDGSPCTDSDTITLTFEAASCGVVTLDPPPPVDGYAVGDTITTMEIEVTGASSVTIDGVACTPSLDPDTNATVTWTYPNPYNVMGPASLAVIATNPNGTVTNCDDIVIDVDCAEANIVGIPSANTTGDIVVEGIPGLTYTVMYSPVCGQAQFDIIVDAQPAAVPADVTIGANGFGYLANVTVVPDVCYYLVCPGDVIASSLRVMTVPTMGEWATIAFVMLVMVAGLVVLRKKN